MGVTAYLDSAALRHNVQQVRKTAPTSRIIAVIKADAYGHGMEWVAKTLVDDVDAYAVARVEEALLLRQKGIAVPIVCLEGFLKRDELILLAQESIQPVIHHLHQVAILESAKLGRPISVWLKIDSGMHRMGVSANDAESLWKRLNANASVKDIRLMTHLASADDIQSEQTEQQFALFKSVTKNLTGETSIANSAGILGWAQSHSDWVRPGIMLYGVSPFINGLAEDHQLKPVMTLKSNVIAINRYKKGDPIGYGAIWQCPEDMPVAVVACGYGDGYPRHAQTGTPVLINGQRVPLVGRVSMDTICVDAREAAKIEIGNEVTLWGQGLPVEEIAESATTIGYELLCNVKNRVIKALF